MSESNRRIRLASRPVGVPQPEDFTHDDAPIGSPGEGEVLLRTRYLSLDPYMRGRLSDAKSYAKPVEIGDVIVGATVSEVVESNSPEFSAGQTVLSYGGWQSYSVEPAAQLRLLDPEAVAVAAATGPVGSAVGQIAKIKGCTAVGIAGGPEKVAFLEELGFDVALDHRGDDLRGALKQAVPQGIDVYFENVSGPVWDAVLPRLNTFARVPVCGLAAGYNATEAPSGPDRSAALMRNILTKSLLLRGFIQTEFVESMFSDFLRDMGQWVREGKVKYREDITEGLDNAPQTFVGMLEGKNFGKTIIQVGE